MPDFTSPNVGNYTIPKGNAYFTPDGGARRHLGNAPEANFSMEVEKLEHFSAMAGIKTKDFTAVLSKSATVTITLEELTLDNFRIALLGGDNEPDPASTEGDLSFEIGTEDAVTGKLEIIGSNDIGPKYTWVFPSVTFTPSGDGVNIISDSDDAVASIQVEGDVNAVNGSFGRITLQDSTTA